MRTGIVWGEFISHDVMLDLKQTHDENNFNFIFKYSHLPIDIIMSSTVKYLPVNYSSL